MVFLDVVGNPLEGENLSPGIVDDVSSAGISFPWLAHSADIQEQGWIVDFPSVCQTSDRNSQLVNIMERLNKNPRCHVTTWVSKFEKYQGSVLVELIRL